MNNNIAAIMSHNYLSIIPALAICAFLAISCGENGKPLDKPEITVDESSKSVLVQNSIPADAGSAQKVSFTTNQAWTAIIAPAVKADESVNWIKVSPDHGNAGTYSLSISLDENTEPEPRSANIKIASGDASLVISITQIGAEITIFNQWEIVGMDYDSGSIGGIEAFRKSSAEGFDVTESFLTKDDSGKWSSSISRDYKFISGDAKGGVIRFEKINAMGRDNGMTYTFTISGNDMTLITAANNASWSNTLYLKRLSSPVEYSE